MTTPRAPDPLPGRARALLSAYREAHSIPAELEDRIWSVVGAEDAPEPAFDPLELAVPRRTGRRVSGRVAGWAGAALAAAAVLLLAWRMGGVLAERREPAPSPAEALMQGGVAPEGRASPPEGRASPRRAQRTTSSAAEPHAAPAGAESANALIPPPSLDPTTRPRRSTETPAPQATSETSTLAAEVALVAQARRSLADGDNARALEITAEHARHFPRGLLVPERVAIESIARCRRGDGDGPERASAFHRAHPHSPFAARVDEACGVTDRHDDGHPPA